MASHDRAKITQQLITNVIIEFGGPDKLGRHQTSATKEVLLRGLEVDPEIAKAAEAGVCTEAGWKYASIKPGRTTAEVTLSTKPMQ